MYQISATPHWSIKDRMEEMFIQGHNLKFIDFSWISLIFEEKKNEEEIGYS